MDEISNNTLLFLAIIAIGISIFGIYTTLTNIGPSLITGGASSGLGSANVTIQPVTSITINPSIINFTQAQPGDNKNSSLASDVQGCSSNFRCGINITNDGNIIVDISLQVLDDMFTADSKAMGCRVCSVPECGGTTNYNKGDAVFDTNTSYVICNITGSANIGGTAEFIDGLNYSDGSDYAYVDVNITVPSLEPTGVKGAILSFTASGPG